MNAHDDMSGYKDIICTKVLNTRGHLDRTNCVISIDEINKHIDDGNVRVICPEPLVFIIDYGRFKQLYYCLNDGTEESIKHEVIENLDEYDDLYLDITLNDRMQESTAFINKLGFNHYKTYLKLDFKYVSCEKDNTDPITHAQEEDVSKVVEMFDYSFNAMCDHIPTKDEIIDFIRNRNIYAEHISGELAGVLLFENTGVRSYLRCLCVAQEHRGKGVGQKLVEKYLSDQGKCAKYFYLWVDEENESAVKLYNRFGYTYSKVKNHIFIRQGKRKE